MAQFIYFRDGDVETGPLDEKAVLDRYNGAEFTSDVAFQFRSSATDSAAPFIILRDLICKNGPANPFCDDFSDIDKRIEEAEKELANLRAIASAKSELEQRIVEIEKVLETRMDKADPEATTSGVVRATEETESRPLCACASCGMVLANAKQALLHSNLSCPEGIARTGKESDFARWKEEDADRLSMGRRLFSAMSPDEKGSARPSPDFIEEVNDKLKKDMKLGSDAGRQRSMQFMESDGAKKINDRFEKHLREAKGKLLCNQCKVACKTHTHFIIHLATYGHRLKVKGTSFELISLLLGSFRGDLYLNEADPSELDDNVEPDGVSTRMESMSLSGGAGPSSGGRQTGSMERREEMQSSGEEEECLGQENPCTGECSVGGLSAFDFLFKQQMLQDLSQRTIISCTECNAMYTNFKQFLVHIGSDQHVENVRKVKQSREEADEDQRGHEHVIKMFDSDLQKWRWADRAQLAGGRKVCRGWSEEEKRQARPTEGFIQRLNTDLARTIKKKPNGKYEEYFLLAERYFVAGEAKRLMEGMEKHLQEGKLLMCAPCKFGCKDSKAFFTHCMTYDHVRITQGSDYELPTILIGVQKRDLYV